MLITIRLYHSLTKYLPNNCADMECKLELRDGLSIDQILSKMGVPDKKEKICFVNNGQGRARKNILCDGDLLTVMDIAGGG